jgi:hypothetical protein
VNYLLGLALNHDPPDLCLLSSWDYRCELLGPGFVVVVLFFGYWGLNSGPHTH